MRPLLRYSQGMWHVQVLWARVLVNWTAAHANNTGYADNTGFTLTTLVLR